MIELIFPATVAVTEQTIDISGFTPAQKVFYLNLFFIKLAEEGNIFHNFLGLPVIIYSSEP